MVEVLSFYAAAARNTGDRTCDLIGHVDRHLVLSKVAVEVASA